MSEIWIVKEEYEYSCIPFDGGNKTIRVCTDVYVCETQELAFDLQSRLEKKWKVNNNWKAKESAVVTEYKLSDIYVTRDKIIKEIESLWMFPNITK